MDGMNSNRAFTELQVTGSAPASEHVRTRPSRHEVQKCPIVVHVVVTMYSRFEGFPHLHRPDPVSPGRVPYTKALHAHRRPRVARAPPKRGAAAAYFAYNLCRHRCPHASCTSYFLLHVLDEMLPSLPTQLLLRPQLETRLDDDDG